MYQEISFKRRSFFIEKQIKYFACKFKKAINFGKLYLLNKRSIKGFIMSKEDQ